MSWWVVMRAALVRSIGSSKFLLTVVGAITMILVRTFHIGEDQAAAIANNLVALVVACVAAQGLADFGKEKEVVHTSLEPTKKTEAPK